MQTILKTLNACSTRSEVRPLSGEVVTGTEEWKDDKRLRYVDE